MKFESKDFSEESLRRMYALSIANGYKSIFFGEEKATEEPYILWRHDIDIELPAVQKMAEIEYEENIRSTYFFMVSSWFYNLFSKEARETISKIKDLGHSVALHCDLGVGREEIIDEGKVNEKIDKEFALLELEYPGIFDRIVSFHNPPKDIINRNFTKFYSTYSPKFFKEIKYLSDSNRIWREGRPENWLNVNSHPKLSILLHPIIWKYGGETMPEAVGYYLEEKMNVSKENLRKDDVYV